MTLRYRFADFQIEIQSFRLLKAGKVLAIEPKALNLLIFLVQNRGRLLERRELIDAVWNEAFVTDHVLNRAVGQLRKLLQDDAKEPRYIETVHTLGYRFVADVEQDVSESVDANPTPAQLEQVREPGQQQKTTPSQQQLANSSAPTTATSARDQIAGQVPYLPSSRPKWRLAVELGLSLLVAVGILAYVMKGRTGQASSVPSIRSLAVLPLENLSGDAAQEYLADGVTDELNTGLGEIASLKVISRTTARQYKNPQKPLQQISKELNVDAVVEGSVQRSGDRIRIAVQLVDAAADKQLWAKSYEGDLKDILGMENQVSSAVTEQIRAKLTPLEQSRLASAQTVDPRAYEALLKGFAVEEDTPETERKALQYFQQAVQIDPKFARAYVAIARAYNFLAHLQVVPLGEATAAADQANAKALELDPGSAEAYDSRGWTLMLFHWDFPGAERDFRRALELAPIGAAHDGLANYYTLMGRFDEAIPEMRRAVELDPLSPLTLTDSCRVLAMARRYDEALQKCQAALALDPDHPYALDTTASIYTQLGNHVEERKLDLKMGCDPTCVAMLDEVDGVPGKKGAFEAFIKHWKNPDPMVIAYFAGRLGRKDEAFAWLEKSYEQHLDMGWMLYLGVDPQFDSLRSDPRFDAFLKRVGLPPKADVRMAANR